jgi:hypothetical protein
MGLTNRQPRSPFPADSAAAVCKRAREHGADDMADETGDRWTVRGISKAYRDKAAAGAARGKLSVGEWLCKVIDQAVQAEREPFDVIGPSDMPSAMALIPADTGAELVRIERVVAAAVALAGADAVPAGMRRTVNRLLRESLPKPAPQEQPPQLRRARRPRLAGGTDAAA